MDENAQEESNIAAVYAHGSSSCQYTQQDLDNPLDSSNAVPVIRASSSPLSSPLSLTPLSPFPPSPTTASSSLQSQISNVANGFASPGAPAASSEISHRSICREETTGPDLAASPPLNNSRDDSVLARTRSPRLGSDYDPNSDPTGRAGESRDAPHTVSKGAPRLILAADHRSALPPSSADIPIFERLGEDLTWTKKRLGSNFGQAVTIRREHPAEAQNVAPKTKRGMKRKTSTYLKPSPGADRISPEPLVALINEIGQTNTTADIRESVRKLKAMPHQVRNPAEGLYSGTPMPADAPPAWIIQAAPNLARQIEGSAFNEQLSRICNRMASQTFTASIVLHTPNHACSCMNSIDIHASILTGPRHGNGPNV